MHTYKKSRIKYVNITLATLLTAFTAIFFIPSPQNSNAGCNPPTDECCPETNEICVVGSVSCGIEGGTNFCPGEAIQFTSVSTHTPGYDETTETFKDCSETTDRTDHESQDPACEWSIDSPASVDSEGNVTVPSCGTYMIELTCIVNECDTNITCSASLVFTVSDSVSSIILSNITISCENDIPDPDPSLIPDSACGKSAVHKSDSAWVGNTCEKSLTRTYKITDACGYTTEYTQIITSVDTNAPVLEGIPDDETLTCTTNPPWPSVTATDLCSSFTLVSNEVVDIACTGTITRTWIATDICGNSTSAVQVITIETLFESVTVTPSPVSPGGTAQASLNSCPDLDITWSVSFSPCDTAAPLGDNNTGTVSINADGLITVSDDCPNGWAIATATSGDCIATNKFQIKCGTCAGCNPDGSPITQCSFGSGSGSVSPGTGGTSEMLYTINMGKVDSETTAGILMIEASVPSEQMATPFGIELSTHPRNNSPVNGNTYAPGIASLKRVEPIYDTNGLRQIWAPECLTDIIVETPYKYRVDIYDTASPYFMGFTVPARPDDSTLHAPNGNLIVSYTIENPNGDGNYDVLNIIENRPGNDPRTTTFTYNSIVIEGMVPSWQIDTADGRHIVALNIQTNSTQQIITSTISDQTTIASERTTTKQEFPWGFSTVKSVTGSGSESLTNAYSYYTTSGNTSYGQKKLITNSDGSWKRYDSYDSEAREDVVVSSWGNAETDATASSARATYFSYAPVDGQDTITERPDRPRTTTVKIEGEIVSKTYSAYYLNASDQRVEITELAYSASTPYGDSQNQRSTTIYNPNSTNAGSRQISSRTTSAGKLDTYTYDYGTWTYNQSDPGQSVFTVDTGTYTRVTIVHGITNSPAGIANQTTQEIIIEDGLGKTVMRESYIYTGGTSYERIAWTVNEINGLGETSIQYNSNGTKTETVMASCGCGKESETDAQGLTTEHQYNALHQLVFTSRELGTSTVITTNSFDAAGHRLSTTITAKE